MIIKYHVIDLFWVCKSAVLWTWWILMYVLFLKFEDFLALIFSNKFSAYYFYSICVDLLDSGLFHAYSFIFFFSTLLTFNGLSILFCLPIQSVPLPRSFIHSCCVLHFENLFLFFPPKKIDLLIPIVLIS